MIQKETQQRKRKLAEKNHNRKIIIDENLMQYIDSVKLSDRNKDIITLYVNGTPYRFLAEKYGISVKTVADIISRYKGNAYKERKKGQPQ